MVLQLEPGKARGKFNKDMWSNPRYVVENKWDGAHYLMHVDIGESKFTSRHISKKTGLFVEKTDNLPHLRDYFVQEGVDKTLEGCVFDGEIVYQDTRSKSVDVTKVMGSLPLRAVEIQEEQGKLDYYIFDILFNKGKDIRNLPYETRRAILVDHLEGLVDLKKHISITPVIFEDKERFYQDIIEQGGEGVILKDKDAPYGKNWAKVKRMSTFDVIITGFEDPTEITKKVSGEETTSKFFEKGWIGAIKFGQIFEGEVIDFGTCSGIDDALREEISANKDKYLGRVIEIAAQERLPSGRFRHPRFIRFRPDKNPGDCVYRMGEI